MKLFARRPDAKDVVHRALCLGIIVTRGQEELAISENADPAQVKDHRRNAAEAWAVAKEQDLASHLSRIERQVLEMAPGAWSRQMVIDAGWRAESLGVLLWALDLISKILPYDEQFSPDDIIPKLTILASMRGYQRRATLRSKEEINRARDTAEHWHWRARTTQIQRAGTQPPAGLTFPQIIKISAEGGYRDGMNPAPIRDDFPAFGKAYVELAEKEYSLVTSIAMERHFALNWLCGYSKDWDETPTDT